MQQVYLKRMTKQDITKSVTICTESVKSFWGIDPDMTNEYVPISICHEDNPLYLPDGITIHKGYQGIKDWRICGNEWKKLYAHENPEEGDIMAIRKLGSNSFSVKIIKKDSDIFKVFSSLFVGNDNYVIINTDKSDSFCNVEYPLQQIFYGAPGTGKSFKINEVTKKYPTIRTTFHPDSDYSTFVGAYKPVMDEVDMQVVPVVLNNGISLQDKGVYSEKRISYRFIKQAFMKAYIKAWRMFADSNAVQTSKVSNVEIHQGIDTWFLNEIDNDLLYYTKESIIDIAKFEEAVKNCWNHIVESDDPDNYTPGTVEMYEYSACFWYKENNKEETIWDRTADDCWNSVREVLLKGETINSKPRTQSYSSLMNNENKVKITTIGKAKKLTIKANFEKVVSGNSIQKKIAEKLKGYSLEFEDAWNKLKDEVNGGREQVLGKYDITSVPSQFLVIEEINRGNCAQIFGDLFQLLDRKKGFSEYPIEADEDIRKCLLCESTEEDPSFGENGLHFTANQTDLINGVFNEDSYSPFRDVAKEIACGKVLVLPPNLYIWATMNTSDQSLFPIDSAFKRRWDWEYIPIGYKNKTWKIVLGKKEYNWVDFQRKINDKIYSVDNSEDKQLGDYFVNADQTDNKISADTLLNKILFYLWNDVCKDEPDRIFRWKDDQDGNKEKDIKFSEFFCEKAEKERKLQGFMAFLEIKADGDDEKKVEQNDDTTAGNDDVVNS